MKKVSVGSIFEYKAVIVLLKHDTDQCNYVWMTKGDVYRHLTLQFVCCPAFVKINSAIITQ